MEGLYGLVAFVVAWLVAQVSKTILGLLRGYRTGEIVGFGSFIGYFMRSGGMPSGHSASVTALCVYLGCLNGFNSSVFALSVGVLIIVLYDAINVRYAVGEQGKALNRLLQAADRPTLHVVEGHTLPQVIVGVLIGVAVGFCTAAIVSIDMTSWVK